MTTIDVPAVKTCAICREQLPITAYGLSKTRRDGLNNRCRPCDATRCRIAYYRTHPDAVPLAERQRRPQRTRPRPPVVPPVDCALCGAEFAPRWGGGFPNVFCSAKCRQRARHNAFGGDRARAVRFGVEYEVVSRIVVYERDGWRCGICRRRIRRTLRHPHPQSASLDHIVPMSLGGPHTYVNCQAAHLVCNLSKAAGGTDQMRLFW